MAISYTHYQLLKRLADSRCIKHGGTLLEIGQANLYGDFRLEGIDTAGQLYQSLFAPSEVVAIDLDPSSDALKFDLNEQIDLVRKFNCVINHGTAEHIFNIAEVFRTMHNHCERGGTMVHECPFTGWLDHGFYCLQPTLFWDVARANNYQVMLFATEHLASRTYELIESREVLLEKKRRGELADNLMLYVALRKVVDTAFRVPIQGVYAGTAGEVASAAWGELR